MTKLKAVAHCVLTFCCSIIALIAIAYWVLLPVEGRPHLISLLSRSFTAFAQSLGTNRSGWLVSKVYASLFLIIVTVVLIGIGGGLTAMRQHRAETTVALTSVAILIVIFYGFIYIRTVVSIVYNEHQSAISEHSRLLEDVQHLTRELNALKTVTRIIESSPAKSAAISRRGSPKTISPRARTVASDALDFQGNKLRNLPMIVIGGFSPDLTRKTMEDSSRYNDQAIVEFLKRFGGPIESIMREIRPYGIDTSRLQRHIEELNSIQMMRLIADDLNDIANQLDPGDLLSSNGRMRTRTTFSARQ